ncbi:hypothetical protein CLOM_g2219 [Closterium sp. NIES-68]|nr:hypothetical protein CLOM_g2219 [Closterium sp. NIES-68]
MSSPGPWGHNQRQEPRLYHEELQAESRHACHRTLPLLDAGLKHPDALDLTLRCNAAGAAATTVTTPTATTNDISRLRSFNSKAMAATQSDSESPSSKLQGYLNEAYGAGRFAGDDAEDIMTMNLKGVSTAAGADCVRATLASTDVAAEGRSHDAAQAGDSLLSQLEKLEAEWMAGSASKKPRYVHVMMQGAAADDTTHGDDHTMMEIKPPSSAAPGSALTSPLQRHLHRIQADIRTQHREHGLEDSPDQWRGAAFSPSLPLACPPQPLPPAGAVRAAASASEVAAKDSAAPAATSRGAAPIQPLIHQSKKPHECGSADSRPSVAEAAVDSSSTKQLSMSSPVLLACSSSSSVHVVAGSRVIVPRSAWAQTMVVNHLERAQGVTNGKRKSGSMLGHNELYNEVLSSVRLSVKAKGEESYSSAREQVIASGNKAGLDSKCLHEAALGECSGKQIHEGRGVVMAESVVRKPLKRNMSDIEEKETLSIVLLGRRVEAELASTAFK